VQSDEDFARGRRTNDLGVPVDAQAVEEPPPAAGAIDLYAGDSSTATLTRWFTVR
jgi:hypothetical protein